MLDGGEGVVEVMQEGFPPLVFGWAAEALGVIFEAIPLDEQQVTRGLLDPVVESRATGNRASRR